MQFGVCVTTKLADVDLAVEAETLGYDSCWVPDSQMIWSDAYAYMALAAVRTRRIVLATGVAVAGTRTAPVTAHSIASIHTLAPGRVRLGVGTGNTAWRLMGQPPLRPRAYEDFLRVVRGLLHGQEVSYRPDPSKEAYPIRFLMPERGFMRLDPPVPLYVSGFGPRAQALAGAYGDGLVLSIPPEAGFMRSALKHARHGAEAAGRPWDEDAFHTTSLTTAVFVADEEELQSERVLRECGPFVMSSVHYIHDKIKERGGDPPPHMRDFWKDYCLLIEREPAYRRHLRLHEGHCTYLLPEEAPFCTPAMIRKTCLVGRPQEVCEQVQALEDAGLKEIILLPATDTQRTVFRRFAQEVLERVA